MKSVLLLIAAAALAIAQDTTGYFPGIPSCAIPCLTSAISEAGCQLSDISCQCGPTQTVIAGDAAPCLLSECSAGSLVAQAASAGRAVCSSYRAGLLTFPTVTATATATTTTTGGSASSSASSGAAGGGVTSAPASSTSASASSGSSGSVSATGGGLSGVSATSSSTRTETLGGVTSSAGSALSSLTSSVPTGNAAAAGPGAPVMLGAGVIAGFLGAVVAL
ncbi:hypothetical protein GGR56DRAFT_693132 [Xylariaceae sp. FL0804]|nr:hypothetical protein GGR56DRAFT_693132 [Xylariaceae sp. FL0804]